MKLKPKDSHFHQVGSKGWTEVRCGSGGRPRIRQKQPWFVLSSLWAQFPALLFNHDTVFFNHDTVFSITIQAFMKKQPDDSVIRLDDFIKRSGLVGTGGEAKMYIQAGDVTVNGMVETRRRKQLTLGDQVELLGEVLTVAPFED